MLALGVLFAATWIEAWVARPLSVLEIFGRNSLFIYWIHVELVYGYTTWVIHRRLPLWGTALTYLVFCAAMFGAIRLRDRVVNWWRTTRTPKSAPSAPAAARA
jgi:fucose 4-O-acetylase-like acetyltransferase